MNKRRRGTTKKGQRQEMTKEKEEKLHEENKRREIPVFKRLVVVVLYIDIRIGVR